MRTVLRSTALVLFVLGIASQAAAADKEWHATGVINNGTATVFTCTNGSTVPANVTVTIYRKDGGECGGRTRAPQRCEPEG